MIQCKPLHPTPSNMSSLEKEKIDNPEKVETLGDLRKDIYYVIEDVEQLILSSPECIAEAILAKRSLQQARHWLGEGLAFYKTDYRVTDNPNDPGSESKPI